MSGEDLMCREGTARLNAVREIDDRRPHGQVTAMCRRLVEHIEDCETCTDALGATGEVLVRLHGLAEVLRPPADHDDLYGGGG